MKEDNYEDIINLPHHVSKRHPQMSSESRAAQFAPFAALSGYADAVKETERLTDERIEIDNGLKLILNNKLQIILDNIKEQPEVTFIYFIYDDKKIGGKYTSITGKVKKIAINEQYVMLTNNTKIPIKEIININSEIFKLYEL